MHRFSAILQFFLVLSLCCQLPACITTRSFGSQLDDAGISASIKALLIQDTRIGALNVEVATDEGEVLLIGRVGSRQESLLAEEHARNVDGVWSVLNHLKVGVAPPGRDGPTDQELKQLVESRLQQDRTLPGFNVRVISHEGEVFLLGRVATNNERLQALGVARETPGVRDIHNYLKAGRVQRLTGENGNG